MRCCFTACELWKLSRRGYVPMDIYSARNRANGCGVTEISGGCGCGNAVATVSDGCGESSCFNNCSCN